MLKNIFTIPDTFDPDDRRRRQVLNVLLTACMMAGLVGIALVLHETCCVVEIDEPMNLSFVLLWVIFSMLLFSVLLIVNRSPKVPSSLTGTVLVIMVIALLTQADTPNDLYNGRSTVFWAMAILIGAVILRPGYIFLITAVIAGLMQFLTPLSNNQEPQVNYYSMLGLFVVAFTAWLGMSIANRAIRDARNKAANLEAILNSIADGVLVLDAQGSFLSANPALLTMIPQVELLEIIRKPLDETVKWKRKVFSVHTSAVPGVGAVAVFRDETRRHETERARDALLATASHELRTPLAASMNYIELMLTLVRLGKIESEAFKEYLDRALENSKRLQHLVDNILDQAQIQAGALELKQEPFDLRALLEKTRQLLEVFIRQKKLGYELSIAPQVPAYIRGDAERLQQVLVNLIGNAVKFTDRGGVRINVSTTRDEELSIEVADSGVGIPSEQLPDIFEAFRRGGNYAQRERQGAGLGLSIVKEIVDRMNGKISATSEPGVGSTFRITVPLEAA